MAVNSSWYQPQPISLAISGQTRSRSSTGPPAAISSSLTCGREEPGKRRPAAAQLIVRSSSGRYAPRRARDSLVPAGGDVTERRGRPGRGRAQSGHRGPRTAAPRGRRTPAPARGRAPLARRDHREVRVRRLLRREVAQPQLPRAGGEGALVGGRCGVEVPGGEDDRVGTQHPAPGEAHDLVARLSRPPVSDSAVVRCTCTRSRPAPGDHLAQHGGEVWLCSRRLGNVDAVTAASSAASSRPSSARGSPCSRRSRAQSQNEDRPRPGPHRPPSRRSTW